MATQKFIPTALTAHNHTPSCTVQYRLTPLYFLVTSPHFFMLIDEICKPLQYDDGDIVFVCTLTQTFYRGILFRQVSHKISL